MFVQETGQTQTKATVRNIRMAIHGHIVPSAVCQDKVVKELLWCKGPVVMYSLCFC